MCDKNCIDCNRRAAAEYGGASVSCIGEIFKNNHAGIREVFREHGIADEVPADPYHAGLVYKIKGPSFARDMTPYIIGTEEFSNLTGSDDIPYMEPRGIDSLAVAQSGAKANARQNRMNSAEEAIGVTSSVLGGLATMGMGIAGMMHRKNNPNQQVIFDEHRHEHDGRRDEVGATVYFGFLRPIHIGLIGFLLLGIGAYVLLGNDKK